MPNISHVCKLVTLGFASLALETSAALAQEAEKSMPLKHLTLDLLMEMESVSSPRISPSGTDVLFTRTWVDRVNDKRKSEIWMATQGGERVRRLCEGSDPEWAPDGKRVAFLREGAPRGVQIHILWIDNREVEQVTRVDEKPSSIRWSPNGKRIAFVMNVPEKENFKITLPDRPKDAKWAPDPTIISRLVYRRDGQGYRPSGFQHLFVVTSEGGTPAQVTDGNFDHTDPAWSLDGNSLIFSGLRTPDADWQWRESEIYDVNVETREVRTLTDRKGPDLDPIVSPDGKSIAYLGFDWTRDTYEPRRLYVMDRDGENPRCLTPDLDREPSEICWGRDNKGIYFSADSNGRSDIYFAPLNGDVKKMTSGTHQITLGDVGKFNVVVGVQRTPTNPGDVVFVLPDEPDKVTLLTHINDDVLKGIKLAPFSEMTWKSTDGTEITGWVVRPPDFDPEKKYPLILQIHGGPHSMYGVGFDFERQNHAAEGYVVLYANPRGSTGYGKAFGNAINNAYPGVDYDDLMTGVDALIEKGSIDPERLYVFGGSGGGVLTAWIVGKTERFRAAVSMFPVTNWISFVGTTDGIHWYNNFQKPPWEDITEHWERSPLRLAGNIKTPTLFITGELDLRTPIGQSEELYQALKLRKIDTALIRIPDEYHGAAGRFVSNQLRRILYVREWFKRHS